MIHLLCIFVALAGWASAQDKPLSGAANLELTVYLVSGLAQAQANARDEVPQDLTATLQQLHGVFDYKSYKLIDAVTLRGRNNGGSGISGRESPPKHPVLCTLISLRLEITRRHSERAPDPLGSGFDRS
jgi:hypothetical protein